MSIHNIYYLTCSQCGKIYEKIGFIVYGDSPDEVKDEAIDDGWICECKVENGSLWDFCSKKCMNC